MIMRIRVTHRAAIEHHGMIQQGSVALRDRLQLLEQVGERGDMIPVQYGKPVHVLLQVGVVRQDVESIAHAALGVNGVAEFFRHQ